MKNLNLKSLIVALTVTCSMLLTGCLSTMTPNQQDKFNKTVTIYDSNGRPVRTEDISAQGRGVNSIDIEEINSRDESYNRRDTGSGSSKSRVCQEEEFKNSAACKGQ